MRFAQVVPIRRMPAQRPWLTYGIPDGMIIVPGSLVSVPLRQTPVSGLVWGISDQQPSGIRVQNIRSVVLHDPIITPWQKKICTILADSGSTSLGDVVFRALPNLSPGRIQKAWQSSAHIPSVKSRTFTNSFLWYRQRTSALSFIDACIERSPGRSVVIVTPTIDDAQEIVQRAEKLGRTAVHLHSKLSPTEYAGWYFRVLHNEPLVIVGGIFSLALPFRHAPVLLLDQEEHHAHKQTAQFPYYDARVVIDALSVARAITTPAPSLRLYRHEQPTVPAPRVQQKLISLHGPTRGPLISEELLTLIDSAVDQQKMVVCISPRRGFSSYTTCRSCGIPLQCPNCGRLASLFRGITDEARCHACQTAVPLTVTCPRCHSSAWSFHGLGVEQTVAWLQRLRPKLNIAPVIRTDVQCDVAVDTYQAYRVTRHLSDVSDIILVSGDSLLTAPDYSVAERAWQYLARLHSENNQANVSVQTWLPENTFWQRWLHDDDRLWYDHELAERKRHNVPPFTRQWIASLRGPTALVEQKIQNLRSSYSKSVEVKLLPEQQRQPSRHRLLLTFLTTTSESDLPWQTVFPLPWHIDRYPMSWLD